MSGSFFHIVAEQHDKADSPEVAGAGPEKAIVETYAKSSDKVE